MRRRPRCPAVWCPKAITILYHSFTFLSIRAPLAYPPATYRVECDCPTVRPLLSHLNRLHNPFIYRVKRVWYLLRSAFGRTPTRPRMTPAIFGGPPSPLGSLPSFSLPLSSSSSPRHFFVAVHAPIFALLSHETRTSRRASVGIPCCVPEMR